MLLLFWRGGTALELEADGQAGAALALVRRFEIAVTSDGAASTDVQRTRRRGFAPSAVGLASVDLAPVLRRGFLAPSTGVGIAELSSNVIALFVVTAEGEGVALVEFGRRRWATLASDGQSMTRIISLWRPRRALLDSMAGEVESEAVVLESV